MLQTLQKSKIHLIFVIFISLFLAACTQNHEKFPSAENGRIDFSNWNFFNSHAVPLDGKWEFYRNQFISYHDFTDSSKKYTPEYLQVPGYCNDKSGNSHTYGTYRLLIKTKPSESLLFIKIKSISTAFTAYANELQIAKAGEISRSENGFRPEYKPILIPVNLNQIYSDSSFKSEFQLIIQVSNFSHANSGLWETLYIGNFQAISYYRDSLLFIKLLIAGLILIMSLYHFGLFALRTTEKSYLYFAIFSFLLVFRNLTTDEIPLLHWFSGGFEIQRKIEYFTGYANTVFLILLFNSLFKGEIPKFILKVLVSLGIFIGLIIIIFPLGTYSHFKLFFNAYVFLGGLYIVFGVLLKAWIKKREGAGLAFVGMFILYATAIYDVLRGAGIIQSIYLADFGLAVYIFAQSYVLSKLFSKAFNENIEITEKLDFQNKNLEKIVQTRTSEINQQKEELKSQAENLKETNILVSEKNEELNQQNEEINAQKEVLEKQKDILSQQHERIQSSIKYAGTIQNAILPSKAAIDQYFDSFIIFKPKDVVSGDFYWFAHLPQKGELGEKYFFATVDCTGHGVPGAFMSMIGSRLLNEIVNEKKITNPAEILTALDAGVIKSLKQDKSDNNDGMDVCLCRIEKDEEKKEAKITFSGARRPLYFYNPFDKSVSKLVGDRKSIGGISSRNTEQFTNTEKILPKDTILYLTTDGYIDQNNEFRERFGSQKLELLFQEIADKDFETQHYLLETIMSEYMKNAAQRDDITILGIRI